MGTWSHEPFGNDSANDWAYDLEGKKDFSLVEQAVQSVIDNGAEYLDSDVAVQAIAAAEVLAKSLGRGTQSDSCTKKVDSWLKKLNARPSTELLAKTQRALVRIMDADSELRELWEESDEFETWESSVKALQLAIVA